TIGVNPHFCEISSDVAVNTLASHLNKRRARLKIRVNGTLTSANVIDHHPIFHHMPGLPAHQVRWPAFIAKAEQGCITSVGAKNIEICPAHRRRTATPRSSSRKSESS
ncbi:hypothetical protein, partial [Sphingomonas sp. SRS2]|uniref:hypothetical protein n=1 Tax=Sphingomonas sp. SRS2 TaxID=133190 RepID=UPI001F1C76B8